MPARVTFDYEGVNLVVMSVLGDVPSIEAAHTLPAVQATINTSVVSSDQYSTTSLAVSAA